MKNQNKTSNGKNKIWPSEINKLQNQGHQYKINLKNQWKNISLTKSLRDQNS